MKSPIAYLMYLINYIYYETGIFIISRNYLIFLY